MHGRGIKPFTKRVEDCRHQPSKQTAGGGSDYVKWLEDEPKRRLAEMIETEQMTRGLATAEDVQYPD